jgi:hypothetical protein
MISARQLLRRAGPAVGLPLFLFTTLLLQSGVSLLAKEEEVLTFQEIGSTCIDLAHYDAKTKQLTVRFVDRDTDRFYRYSKVPTAIWKKVRELNEAGGVGNYFTSMLVQHPEKYPFEKVIIRNFKTIPKKKKAGDSK